MMFSPRSWRILKFDKSQFCTGQLGIPPIPPSYACPSSAYLQIRNDRFFPWRSKIEFPQWKNPESIFSNRYKGRINWLNYFCKFPIRRIPHLKPILLIAVGVPVLDSARNRGRSYIFIDYFEVVIGRVAYSHHIFISQSKCLHGVIQSNLVENIQLAFGFT